MTQIIELENVLVQYSKEVAEPDRVYDGKPMPTGKSITISCGEKTSQQGKELNKLVMNLRKTIRQQLAQAQCVLKGEEYDEDMLDTYGIAVEFKALKSIDASRTESGKAELGLQLDITKFSQKGKERTISEPLIIMNGKSVEGLPWRKSIVDIEFTIEIPEAFSGIYYVYPVLKTIIVKKPASDRMGSRPSGDTKKDLPKVDLSGIFNAQATVLKEDSTSSNDNTKVTTPPPKPTSTRLSSAKCNHKYLVDAFTKPDCYGCPGSRKFAR